MQDTTAAESGIITRKSEKKNSSHRKAYGESAPVPTENTAQQNVESRKKKSNRVKLKDLSGPAQYFIDTPALACGSFFFDIRSLLAIWCPSTDSAEGITSCLRRWTPHLLKVDLTFCPPHHFTIHPALLRDFRKSALPCAGRAAKEGLYENK